MIQWLIAAFITIIILSLFSPFSPPGEFGAVVLSTALMFIFSYIGQLVRMRVVD